MCWVLQRTGEKTLFLGSDVLEGGREGGIDQKQQNSVRWPVARACRGQEQVEAGAWVGGDTQAV